MVAGRLLIAESGAYYVEAKDPNGGCVEIGTGTLASDGSTVSGSGHVAAVNDSASPDSQTDCMFPDGSTWGTETISGAIIQPSSLTFTATTTTANGTVLAGTPVTLTYDDQYTESSSLGKIAGSWILQTGDRLTISTAGVLHSEDPATGCTVNGSVSIIDPNYNAYSVSLQYSGSGCSGSASILNGIAATGLLSLDDTVTPNQLFAGYTLTLPNAQTIVVDADATWSSVSASTTSSSSGSSSSGAFGPLPPSSSSSGNVSSSGGSSSSSRGSSSSSSGRTLAYAQTALTLTASTLTMEQGQPVPPPVWVQSTYPTTCTGAPTLSTTATSASTPGRYAISASAGTFACTGYTISTVDGTMNVIAADGIGAQINNAIVYPPGFTSASVSYPILDVTSNSICNMVGDNATDNTTCLNTLLSRYKNSNCSTQPSHTTYLYFPAGTYLVSGQINPCGNDWTLFGLGPQTSIIRLAPNSSAFNTGTKTQWFNPLSVGGNANSFEFIYGIGFDVGYGNPNAIPVTLEMNNVGAMKDSIIWSEDGNCPYAFSLNRGYPGPALSKDVAIYGCVTAVSSNQIEYNWVFDEFTTEGQNGLIVNSTSSHFSFQHWLSDGSMSTALVQYGGAIRTTNWSTIALLDSSLLNGQGILTGIINASGASVFARNVTVTGYSPSEIDSGTGTPVTYTGNLTQNWSGAASGIFNANLTASSLYLPQAETPLPTDDPTPSNWTVLGSTIANWCSQITGSLSVTVYAPPAAGYTGGGTHSCSIPDTVNHINFYNALAPGSVWNFTVAGSSSTPLVIDGCIYNSCKIFHTGTRTVVVRDSYLLAYQASAGAGNAFFEDTMLYTTGASPQVTFEASQNIWARQLDLEYRSGPEFICNGCTLWMLGYKTENLPDTDPVVVLNSGAQAEIFGSFFYPLSASAGGTALIYSTNSRLLIAPIFSFDNVTNYGWQYWVQERKGLATVTLPNPSYPALGNYTLNMYYSLTGSASAYALDE